MELGGDQVFARDRGTKGYTVIRARDYDRGVGRNRIVGVDEIKMAVVGDAGEDRMGANLMHPVPADLRNLQRATVHCRRKAYDLTGNHAEAALVILFAVIHQNLNADTNA